MKNNLRCSKHRTQLYMKKYYVFFLIAFFVKFNILRISVKNILDEKIIEILIDE